MKTIRPNHTGEDCIISYSHKPQKTQKPQKEISVCKGDIVDINDGRINFVVDDVIKKDELYIFIKTDNVINEEEKKEEKEENTQTIEKLMNDLLPKKEEIEDDKKITFEVTLTKRQKEIFDNKGGVKWLKQILTGTAKAKKTRKRN